jgi:hypothetical protein
MVSVVVVVGKCRRRHRYFAKPNGIDRVTLSSNNIKTTRWIIERKGRECVFWARETEFTQHGVRAQEGSLTHRSMNGVVADAFDDWSPASVFGSTVSKPTDRSFHSPVRSKRPLDVGTGDLVPSRSLPPDNNKNGQTQLKSPEETKTVITRSPEQADGEGDFDTREEDAACVIQKYWRVALLYRREVESLCHVHQLQLQLELASINAIIEWYRRSRRRNAILRYVAWHQQQQGKHKQEAGDCLVRWLYWQSCIARARRTLQRRTVSRRRLVCWWRRVLWIRSCQERQRVSVERLCAESSRVITRFLYWVVERRRASRQRIGAFLLHGVLRRRALTYLQQRRRRREALRSMARVVNRRGFRRALSLWREQTRQQRDAEARQRYHAACVLQRLVRVVLTAFRLLRRRDAATTIQSLVRTRQAQRHYATWRLQRRRRAAIQIQRIVRGVAARTRVARLLHQLRERFQCQNCGLIEPGGLYCKFCGRRRTTFDVLGVGVAAASCTTDSKLRKKRRNVPMPSPPPAPPVASYTRENHRVTNGSVAIETAMLLMPMPALPQISPRRPLPAVLVSSHGLPQGRPLAVSPIQPRKPAQVRSTTGRRSLHHRSLSITSSAAVIANAAVASSAEETRQRADALMRHEVRDQSATMNLHLKRLQKGGKAASR